MTNRVVYGALPGGGYGLRVSRPGNDVLNTGLTGPQLAFDSRWPMAMNIDYASTGTAAFGTNFTLGATYPTPPVVVILYIGPGGQYRIGAARVGTSSFTLDQAHGQYFIPNGSAFSYWVCSL